MVTFFHPPPMFDRVPALQQRPHLGRIMLPTGTSNASLNKVRFIKISVRKLYISELHAEASCQSSRTLEQLHDRPKASRETNVNSGHIVLRSAPTEDRVRSLNLLEPRAAPIFPVAQCIGNQSVGDDDLDKKQSTPSPK